jgi:metal-sulfur cluster biosynthetic enzyme
MILRILPFDTKALVISSAPHKRPFSISQGTYKSKRAHLSPGKNMVTVEAVEKELEKVVDPEIGLPITEMHLVDEINIQDNGDIFIKYHLTAPFCPPIFAEDIGMNIRILTSKLEGVSKVTVILHGHALANEINQRVNPGYTPPPVEPAVPAQTKA